MLERSSSNRNLNQNAGLHSAPIRGGNGTIRSRLCLMVGMTSLRLQLDTLRFYMVRRSILGLLGCLIQRHSISPHCPRANFRINHAVGSNGSSIKAGPYNKLKLGSHSWTLLWTVIALAGVLLLGCSRDPNAQKQKYFQTGARYLQAGKYREAAIEFQNAIQIDPRFAQAHYQLGECYLRESLWSNAYQELLRTTDLDPQNISALTDLTKLLLAGGRFQDAHDRAAAALRVKPDSFDMQLVLANADAAMGSTQLASAEAAGAIQMAPDRQEGYLVLAILQVKDQKLADAEANFQKAVTIDGGFLPARLLLGQFYQNEKRWPEAEQQYEAAIAAAPSNPAPRAQLARLYLAQNRKDDAERTVADAKKATGKDPLGYRMLGDYYIGIGDSQKALAEYASLSEDHPQEVSVKRIYIQLLLLENQVEKANTLNEQILKANAKDTEAMILRGEIQGRNGLANDAVVTLQNAAKDGPENAVVHFYLGIAYQRTGAPERAESEWRTAVRLAPSLVDAQRALASLALAMSDWNSLADIASQLIQTQPRASLGYIYRGIERTAREDQAAAELNFSRAMELDPGDAVAYTQMAKLRALQKRPAEAEKLFQQALVRDPNSTEALTGLAFMDVQQKQLPRALAEVREQIAKSPNNGEFYTLLGSLLVTAQDEDSAESALQKAVDLNPNNVNAFLLQAQLHLRRGALDKAVADFHQALQKNPRDIRIHLGLGNLEERRGNWQQAQTLYQQALQIKPDDPVVANDLAFLLIEHGGDKDRALLLAQTARRGLPNVGNTADTLGWAYYYQGMFPLAVSTLQMAVKEGQANATYHYHLGLAYQKTVDFAHAKEHLERALELHPTPQQAGEIRKALAENAGS
jgi:tetratricopeptide (TPR) repeat protein